jgi:hypothetical protein
MVDGKTRIDPILSLPEVFYGMLGPIEHFLEFASDRSSGMVLIALLDASELSMALQWHRRWHTVRIAQQFDSHIDDSPSDGMADIRDLKSRGEQSPCGFDSRLGHSSGTSVSSHG